MVKTNKQTKKQHFFYDKGEVLVTQISQDPDWQQNKETIPGNLDFRDISPNNMQLYQPNRQAFTLKKEKKFLKKAR